MTQKSPKSKSPKAGKNGGESKKEWTWQEVAEHNTESSTWVYVEDNVYDVTEWVPRHPGGREMILLFAGRDCTEAMRAYHPFTEKPYAVLKKYHIGKLKGASELVRWRPDTGFYKTVRERCGTFFKENNIDPIQQTTLYEICRFSTSIGFELVGLYFLTKFLRDLGVSLLIRLLLAAAFGFVGVMVAVNVSHLASHLPHFHMPNLNYYIGWLSFDVCLGLSYDIWLHEHIVGHHQYTNIITIDPNAPEGFGDEALYRSSPHQNWYQRFYYQFIWLPLISCLLIVEYRVASIRYWFKGFRKEVRVNPYFLGTRSKILFLLGKFLWMYRVLYMPVWWWNCPAWEALLLFVVSEIVAGYFVGITFPANHITDKVDWPVATKDEKTGGWKMDSEWAITQIKTCKDYSNESWIFSNVFGSLNNHSCHHLFPSMHHAHYRKIYPIVKQTAKDFKIDLPDVGTYGELVYDYINNLYTLGSEASKPKFA